MTDTRTPAPGKRLGPGLAALSGAALLAVCGAAQAAEPPPVNYYRDANGNLTQTAEPLNASSTRSTSIVYDALNRPTQITDGNGKITRLGYDGSGRLSTVTDPRGLVTRYVHDGFGKRTAVLSPDSGTATTSYDEAGRPATRTDARGKSVQAGYDAAGRPTTLTYSDGRRLVLSYDGSDGACPTPSARGLPTALFELDAGGAPQVITQWCYDTQARLALRMQTQGGVSRLIRYEYGAAGSAAQGHVSKLTYPSGNVLSYEYAAGKLTAIRLNGGTTVVDQIAYQPFGAARSWNLAGVASYTREFDLDGRVKSYPVGVADGVTDIRTLGYDWGSRITGYAHGATPSLDQGFGYDVLDRLSGATAGATTRGYTYDADGNRTGTLVGGTTVSYTGAADSNRLSAAGATSYSYAADGSLTSDGSRSFVYDDRGRLVQVKQGATVLASYVINAFGQRVQKTVGAATTGFVYDEAGRLIGEYDGAGNLIEETVYLGDMPVLVIKPGDTPSAPKLYPVFADHLNAPRVIWNSARQVVWNWRDAEPFGNTPPNDNPSGLGTFTYNARFPGQYFDAETGLHHNGHRDYHPALGRYIQSDPIGLAGGSFSTFAYVGANPVSKVDPSGLDPFESGDYTIDDYNSRWSVKTPTQNLDSDTPITDDGPTVGDGLETAQWGLLPLDALPLTLSKIPCLLKFGANDLVYGPSASRALRRLQERAGGKLLTDLPRGSLSWEEFTIETLERQVVSGDLVHFDLTHMEDLNGVLNKTGRWWDTMPGLELRYIQEHWGRFKCCTRFYRDDVLLDGPPW